MTVGRKFCGLGWLKRRMRGGFGGVKQWRDEGGPYQLGEDGRYQPMPLDDGVFRSQALPGFWLRMEWLWQEPLPGCIGILRQWGLL